jgi:hypothetical protein
MLVTSKVDAYAVITMFGNVAVALIKLIGHSGTAPSALLGPDVPGALARPRAAVSADPDTPLDRFTNKGQDGGDGEGSHVSLAHRA